MSKITNDGLTRSGSCAHMETVGTKGLRPDNKGLSCPKLLKLCMYLLLLRQTSDIRHTT